MSDPRLKFFEIRDKGTFIPMLAVHMAPEFPNADEAEEFLLRRAGYGYGTPRVMLVRLDADGSARQASYDPHAWGGRTYPTAQLWLEEHWLETKSGDVIDVEFILGETPTKKLSERLTQ